MNEKWKNEADRFVAYFDILGFKNRVYMEEHITVKNEMYSLYDKVIGFIKEKENETLKSKEDRKVV